MINIESAKAAVSNIWQNAGGSEKNINDTILANTKKEDKWHSVDYVIREKLIALIVQEHFGIAFAES